MSGLSASDVAAWLERYRAAVEREAPNLTRLDAAIGDADHGINLERGFRAVAERVLAQAEGKDVAWILKQTGMTLLSTVGGASGPLYGTLFIGMAQGGGGKVGLSGEELAAALEAGVEGVKRRGRASPGEKTMVDALEPAAAALRGRLEAGADLAAAVAEAARAADEGCLATIPMLATKGRASYLGERSVGHQDPGATSSALLVRSLLEVLAG